MSITKASIVTVLNNRLKRAETETTIAEEIKAGLKFVSEGGLWPCLWKGNSLITSKGLIRVNRELYADGKNTDFCVLDNIVIYDGDTYSPPLDEISYEDWSKNRGLNGDYWGTNATATKNESCFGKPTAFAARGNHFLLDPIPDDNDGDNYTVQLYFWRYHPDQAEIIFPDCFKEAIYNVVMGKYLEGKGPAFADAAMYYLNISLREMAQLPQDTQFSHVKYHDV